MTAPRPPRTYEEALAAAAALQTAAAAGTVTAVTLAAADQLITAREVATAYAANLILGLWDGVNPYDGDAVQQFTTGALQVMVTAQTAVARAAGATQARQLAAIGIPVSATPSNPVDVRGTTITDTGAIERPLGSKRVRYGDGEQTVNLDDSGTQQIFNRPARQFRYEKSVGATDMEAFNASVDRMLALVDDNLMLAQRLAEAEILAKAAQTDRSIIGLRRVIHPELSRTGTCGLCIVAADQIYKVSVLRPIHDHCKCTTAAVTAGFDPADVLNQADLAQLYKDAGSTGATALKRTRYTIGEHGELGPVFIPEKLFRPRTKPTRTRRRTEPLVAGRQP